MPGQNPQRRCTARTLPNFCVVVCIVCFVSFSVLFVCIFVLYYCHRVATQLQLNIPHHILLVLGYEIFLNAWILKNFMHPFTNHMKWITMDVPSPKSITSFDKISFLFVTLNFHSSLVGSRTMSLKSTSI